MEPLSPLSEVAEDEFFESQESWHMRRSSLCSTRNAVAALSVATSCPEQLNQTTTTSPHDQPLDDITTPAQYDIDDYLTLSNLLPSPTSPCATRSLLQLPQHHALTALISTHHNKQSGEQRLQPNPSGPHSTRGDWSSAVPIPDDREVSPQHLGDVDRQDRGAEREGEQAREKEERSSSTSQSPVVIVDSSELRERVQTSASAPDSITLEKMDSDDLFMQEAETHNAQNSTRIERLLGRDRQSVVPLQEFRSFTSFDDRRPRTSGGGRPVSRLGQLQSQHNVEDGSLASLRQRRGSRHGSVSGFPLSPRSPLNDRNRSPELTPYGRLRPQPAQVARRAPQLFNNAELEAPVVSIERKQSIPDSASADSQTAGSTVWDELDDLKSRIKKLELTGKPMAPTMSSDTSPRMERPRTATTAPTTIDSSPKREKKTDEVIEEVQLDVSKASMATIHPLLHNALTKAKPLLNPALYRSLEATAGDALQMALMTGSFGQGGSPISVSDAPVDRSLRRKADTMCRNLTDLCLALCEGKHEVTTPISSIPPGRFSRTASIREPSESRDRPMSRLEARRSSMLGDSPLQPSLSPRRDRDNMSVIDTPSQPYERRHQRSSSRFSMIRSHFDDGADDDPTVRPPSRNGSEFSIRSRQTPATLGPQRSFSLREALVNRRGSGAGARDLSRVGSLFTDAGRRWARETTPPVVEEESMNGASQPKQRVSSFSQLRQARGLTMTPFRSSSLSRQPPQVMIE